MNILDKITAGKIKEVMQRKAVTTIKELEASPFFDRSTHRLTEALTKFGASGIIAEFKRKSPSKGVLNDNADVEYTTSGYCHAGASVLSVLTDENYFGGSDSDLVVARKINSIPVLRKDFIVEEYQIIESKALGADIILLIAAVLDVKKISQFTSAAHAIGLQVLLEVHDRHELAQTMNIPVDAVGVNNRNLKTFEVSVDTSRMLAELIPSERIKISESGIDSPEVIQDLRTLGYKGFLMGEAFMRQPDPALACKQFIDKLRITA
jgi:indole-3-glycerol phosphate synthase